MGRSDYMYFNNDDDIRLIKIVVMIVLKYFVWGIFCYQWRHFFY